MLGVLIIWVSLVFSTCHAAILPTHGPQGGESRGQFDTDGASETNALGTPGFVRMPISRQIFNGTDRWPWGWHRGRPPGYRDFPPGRPWHGSPLRPTPSSGEQTPPASTAAREDLAPRQTQNPNRWGSSHLDELGGIAYIIECGQLFQLRHLSSLGAETSVC